ncbi:hypothetical protein EV360DRAFT_73202 [Lentinula raphanica]|nr:hypothetical protein EV360DRAFT_73202 [Lentinula raphanica]
MPVRDDAILRSPTPRIVKAQHSLKAMLQCLNLSPRSNGAQSQGGPRKVFLNLVMSSIDVSDNSASIWVLEFVGAATTRRVHNSRKVQPSQDHQMFEADALRIMAGVFDVSYQNVYRDGLQLQGSFGADTDVISSFKVKVTTAPPELKNVVLGMKGSGIIPGNIIQYYNLVVLTVSMVTAVALESVATLKNWTLILFFELCPDCTLQATVRGSDFSNFGALSSQLRQAFQLLMTGDGLE